MVGAFVHRLSLTTILFCGAERVKGVVEITAENGGRPPQTALSTRLTRRCRDPLQNRRRRDAHGSGHLRVFSSLRVSGP